MSQTYVSPTNFLCHHLYCYYYRHHFKQKQFMLFQTSGWFPKTLPLILTLKISLSIHISIYLMIGLVVCLNLFVCLHLFVLPSVFWLALDWKLLLSWTRFQNTLPLISITVEYIVFCAMFKGRRAICKLVNAYSETIPCSTRSLCFFFPLFFLLEKKPRSFPLAMEKKAAFEGGICLWNY